jgi:signal transduction histidine kinase
LVAFDEEGMSNVLDIVVENAVEAMAGGVGSRQNVVDRVLRIRTATGPVGSRQDTVDRVSRESGDSPSEREDARYSPRFRSGGSCVRIEVEDTGMGIPQKYLDKVFEPYFTYGKADGTGLGLALAKKIVEDHKGRMEVQSKEGAGTTVTIILPAKEESG